MDFLSESSSPSVHENLTPEQLGEYEADLQQNPNIEVAQILIGAYKGMDAPDQVKRIRTFIVESATLPEDMWQSWVKDEIKAAQTNEEKLKVLELFDLALDDRLYYDVAEIYIQYLRQLFKEGIIKPMKFRAKAGKLISLFCHDFNRGSFFFQQLIDFELNSGKDAKSNEVKNAVRKVYFRQIKLPFADSQQIFSDYVEWETDNTEKTNAAKFFEETFNLIQKQLDYEEEITDIIEKEESEKLKEFLVKIMNLDIFENDKKIIYFERAIEYNSSDAEIWKLYVDFAEEMIKIPGVKEKIYKRACKNCPFNLDYIIKYARFMEKSKTEVSEIEQVLLSKMRKFSNPYEHYMLWLAILEANIRDINTILLDNDGKLEEVSAQAENFRQMIQSAIDFFTEQNKGQDCQVYIDNLQIFWASVETFTFKNRKQMVDLMEQYVIQHGSHYAAWAQYITFEQALSKPKAVRSVIRRAIEYTRDDYASVFTQALEFERKFGTLDELEIIEKKYKDKQKQLQEQSVVLSDAQDDNNNQVDNMVAEAEGGENEFNGGKRKFNQFQGAQELPTLGGVQDTLQQQQKQFRSLSRPQSVFTDKKNTVFVRNLPYAYKENDIKAIFGHLKVLNVRILKDKVTQQSRGFAYIDFEDEDQAMQACESDGLDIDGRKLAIALSDPPKKGKDDDRTIFLNNLAYSTTEDDIKNHFGEFSNSVVAVRLITDRDGRLKGYAYVEMENKTKAMQAIESIRGKELLGKRLIVQSAESQKNFEQEVKAQTTIIVKRLHTKATEDDVKQLFQGFQIKQVQIPRDPKNNKMKGFAFVEFDSLFDLQKALKLEKPTILDRECVIEKSDTPITQPKGQNKNQGSNNKPKRNAISRRDVMVSEDEERKDVEPIQKIHEKPKNILSNFIPAGQSDKAEAQKDNKDEIKEENTENKPKKGNSFFSGLFNKKK